MGDYVFQNRYGVVSVLDTATMDEPKEIRFIYPDYQEKFRIPDGDQILVTYPTGERKAFVCKYIDDYHVLVGRNAFHICEYAERLQRLGAHVYPFPEKRIVWSNRDLNIEDWRADLKEQFPEADDNELYEQMWEINASYLDDEKVNLNVDVGEDIVMFGTVQRWNGTRFGGTEINSTNLRDCLQPMKDCEYIEWYVDREGELCSTQSHHDGTNCVYYRKWKESVSYDDRNDFFEKMQTEGVSKDEIDAVTDKLGHEVAKVYGWEFPTEEKQRVSARDAR